VVSLPLKILNISCAFAVSLLAMGFMLLIFLLSCLLCGSKLGEGKGVDRQTPPRFFRGSARQRGNKANSLAWLLFNPFLFFFSLFIRLNL
jgi:hypothetical protein